MSYTARVTYPQGAQDTYTVPFPYISQDHVTVLDNDLPYTGSVTWLSTYLVRLTPDVALTHTVTISRTTPGSPLVSFHGGPVASVDLNRIFTQACYLAEEARDAAAGGSSQAQESINAIEALRALLASASPVSTQYLASVAAVQAATIAPAIVFIETAGYTAAGDGGGALYVTSASHTTGGIISGDGRKWRLAEPLLDARQLGAQPDGSDVSAYINFMLSLDKPAGLFGGSYTATAAVTLPANGALTGRKATLLGGPATALIFTGADAQLDSLAIAGTATDQSIYANANAARGRVRDLTLTSAGHGIQLNTAGLSGWRIQGVDASAQLYGLLFNANAGGLTEAIVTGVRASAVQGDAIAFNAPLTAMTNCLVWGGIVKATGGSDANSGFGISLAHVQGFVVGGLVVPQSRQEVIHIEDGSSSGVLIGITSRAAGRDGIRHLKSGAGGHGAESHPLVYVGISLTGAGGAGYYQIWDPNGVQTRNPFVAGFFSGFDAGLWLDGPGLHAVSYISVESVDTVLRLSNAAALFTEASGDFFSLDASRFVLVGNGGGFSLGYFHQEGFLPATFIGRSSTRRIPGVKIRGFSGRCPDFTSTVTADYEWVPLFAAPVRMKGTLTFYMRAAGVPLGHFYSGDVLYTGYLADLATPSTDFLPNQNFVWETSSDFEVSRTAPNLRINGGMVEVKVFFAGPGRTVQTWVEFEGAYYG